jgi:hypothetical protein
MSRRSAGGSVAGAVVGILAVTACGAGLAGGPGGGSTSAPAGPAAVNCPTAPKLPEGTAGEPIPAGFRPAWVLRCSQALRPVPGDGTWHFRIEERADTDAAALLTALRRPDEQTPAGTTLCTAIGFGVPYFALVDASGTVVHPRVPRGRCQRPQRQALEALKALPFRETAATRLNQERSQKSIDTGCGQMWTDGLTGDVLAHTRPAASRRTWQKTPDALRICLWRSRTSGLPELVSARTVTGADLAALLTRLDHLPAARPCATRHQRFAVLEYIRRGWNDSAAYAEVDGCRRILRPDHTLGHLDPATTKLLTT